MGYPRICCDLHKLRENVERWAKLLHEEGRLFFAVTKGVCAHGPIVRMLEESSCDGFADARIRNLASIQSQKPRLLLRIAQAWEIPQVIEHAEMSFQSETETIALLGEEAARRQKRHGVILALDMGDLREGCFFENEEDILQTARAVLARPWLELCGVGTNLGCFGGVRTTPENMARLLAIAQKLRRELNIPLPLVSGMSTAAETMLLDGSMPRAVNHGRFGEVWLVGYDSVGGREVPGMHTDAFTFRAQLVECKTKPSKPIGEIGGDAFGHVIERPDRGPMRRGLLACGVQDMDRDCLFPVDERVEILGGSCDHTIVDLSRAPEYKVGDVLEFRLRYSAMMRAYTSAYVEKEYTETL